MAQRTVDPAAVEAEVDQIRSPGIDALRMRWRATFGRIPPKGLTKDIMGRMIAYRTQEQAFGGLDPETRKFLGRLAKGEKPNELSRRLKAGTVLVREYQGNGTPLRSSGTASFGRRRPTPASPASRRPSPALGGTARGSLAFAAQESEKPNRP